LQAIPADSGTSLLLVPKRVHVLDPIVAGVLRLLEHPPERALPDAITRRVRFQRYLSQAIERNFFLRTTETGPPLDPTQDLEYLDFADIGRWPSLVWVSDEAPGWKCLRITTPGRLPSQAAAPM